MQNNSLILFSLLLLICFIFPSNSQTLNPIIRSYDAFQYGGSYSSDIFKITSTDNESVFNNGSSTINYFIVSDREGGSKMYYNTSNGFSIGNVRHIIINGSLVQLYHNTSITICISEDSCYIGDNNTFIINPRVLVFNVDPIPTRGGVATINGKYFYHSNITSWITIIAISPSDLVFPIYGDSSTQRYFNISDEYSGGSIGNIITFNNINYTVSINFIEPTINSTEQNGNNLIIRGDNFGKYISQIIVLIGSDVLWSTNTIMSVSNHSLLNMTLPDNYLPRSSSLILKVNLNPSIDYPIKIVPIIQSITPISYKGGNITISGYRLMVNQSLSIMVGTHNCTSPTQIEFPRSLYCNLDSMLDDSMVNVTVSVAGVESDQYTFNIIKPDPIETSNAPKLNTILPTSILGCVIIWSISLFFI